MAGTPAASKGWGCVTLNSFIYFFCFLCSWLGIFYNHINNYFRFLLIQMFMYIYSLVNFFVNTFKHFYNPKYNYFRFLLIQIFIYVYSFNKYF